MGAPRDLAVELKRALDLAVCLAAYLYGSLPLVYLLGRRGGADLRTIGSGNVGASNQWATSTGSAGCI